MSLNQSQRVQTAQELQQAATATGLTAQELASRLGLPVDELGHLLAVADGVDPAEVWQVRDLLDAELQHQGKQPAWSTLTDANRLRAQAWFGLDSQA